MLEELNTKLCSNCRLTDQRSGWRVTTWNHPLTSDSWIKCYHTSQVRLTGVDKEVNALRETMATLKAEKQSLENFASSLEKKWSNNEARRAQLEKENQQLTTDKERLHTQVSTVEQFDKVLLPVAIFPVLLNYYVCSVSSSL